MNGVWLLFFIFLFGLIIGSFINCVVYRLRVEKSFWRGRSFCPTCRHQLAWYDNIPVVSFLILKGRCRYCRQNISWQYPLVELITGILFVVVFAAEFGLKPFYSLDVFNGLHLLILVRNWLFTSVLVVIFIYDLKYYLILDKVSLPAMVMALIFNLVINLINYSRGDIKYLIFNILGPYVLVAGVIAGFFLLQFIISRGKWIGGGDIRLGALMGLMLGWPNALLALVLGYILGSIVGISLITAKKKKFSSQVPLGTFLSISTLIALLWGTAIIDWYFNLTLNFI